MRILVCSILFLVACSGQDILSPVCSHECYTGPKETKNVGECKSGTTICAEDGYEKRDEEGNIICDGEVLPSKEVCDLLDNDCDHLADDYLYPVHSYDTFPKYDLEEFPCKSIGGCNGSVAWCNDGEWDCSYVATCAELDSSGNVVENETLCDGCDGDCDGRVDENVFDSMSINDRVCYSGNPISTAAYPPCRAGLLECIFGETICFNEVTPSVELCDGIDNDCNGVPDDTGDVLQEKYDIVFIVDTSGSMCDEIAAVAGACNAYAAQFDNNPNFQFALVIMSKNNPPYVRLDTNFTDFANIRSRLQILGCNGGGLEASLDSMYEVCDKVDNKLELRWRDDANSLFFALTDEQQQTYLKADGTWCSYVGCGETTGQMIIDACIASGTLPFIWAKYPTDFQYIVQGGNGQYFNLVNDWQTIFDNMNSIVVTLCSSGG